MGPSLERVAAVDHERLPGDPARLLRYEKRDRVGDVRGRPEPAEGDVALRGGDPALVEVAVGDEAVVHAVADRADADAVGAHAEAALLEREVTDRRDSTAAFGAADSTSRAVARRIGRRDERA